MFTVSLKMLGKNTFEITIVYLKAFYISLASENTFIPLIVIHLFCI